MQLLSIGSPPAATPITTAAAGDDDNDDDDDNDVENSRCDTFSGPSTDATSCRCHRCRNCGATSSSSSALCNRCQQLPECRSCKRRLPSYCFADSSNLCESCIRKKNTNPQIRSSTGNVVTEIAITTEPADITFDAFMRRNRDRLHQIGEEYRQRFG